MLTSWVTVSRLLVKLCSPCCLPKVVDFDATEQEEMSITVTACDPDYCADVDVTFRVYDVNDNAPVFDPDFIEDYVAEDAPVGTIVATFTATDDDTLPINAEFE